MIWVYSILIVLGAFYLGSWVGLHNCNRRWKYTLHRYLSEVLRNEIKESIKLAIKDMELVAADRIVHKLKDKMK